MIETNKEMNKVIRQVGLMCVFVSLTYIGFAFDAFHWWLVTALVIAFIGGMIPIGIKMHPIETRWGRWWIGEKVEEKMT